MGDLSQYNVDMSTIDGSSEEMFIDFSESQNVAGTKFKTVPDRISEWIARHQSFYTKEGYRKKGFCACARLATHQHRVPQ